MRRARKGQTHILDQDHAERRRGGRFRWFLSTCLAAGIGAFAIIFIVLGARDPSELGTIVGQQVSTTTPALALPEHTRSPGLQWAVPKGDRLVATNEALSTRFLIQEPVIRRRDNREYLHKRSYLRVVGRLFAAPPPNEEDRVPPFNPYTLYAQSRPSQLNPTDQLDPLDVDVRVSELLGGLLPTEDGQEMDQREVVTAVMRTAAYDELVSMRASFSPDLKGASRQKGGLFGMRGDRALGTLTPPNTTDITKTRDDADDDADSLDIENREVRVVAVRAGDTLTRIIDRLAGDIWQKRAIVDAASPHVADNALNPGDEVHVTLVPSVTREGRFEPHRVSIFGRGHEHKVTVALTPTGDFVAGQSPIDAAAARRAAMASSQNRNTSQTLYNAIFVSALSQGIRHDIIERVLRIHSSETDYRRRVRPTDQIEFFFDARDEDGRVGGDFGELLLTAMTTGGTHRRYYRFRSQDGTVDYYDPDGNTARQFLLRKPVQSDDVRLSSGFGMRRHPLLGIVRLHAGVDWSGPIGTPIMAAGSGTVEEAGRKGNYGNYVRIRHANGYTTSYAHMHRIASGISDGVRVNQGQIIGYIGNTGLSAGPHLHYEVMVNNQYVDPMSIQAQREHQLTGRQLAEFHKERVKIDDLMRRNPTATSIVDAPTPN